MKLLIVESNGLFRAAFARRFQSEEDIDLVGEIDHLDAAELPAEVEVLEPDVILIGVGVADSDTLAAINRVMAGHRHPGVLLHGRSLTLPAAMKVAEILRSIDHGFAYLDTDRIQSLDGMVAIVRVVAEGKVVIDPQTTQRLLGLISTHIQAMASLTIEERRLLSMLARGETDEAAAEVFGMDRSMVSAMIVDVAAKFGVDGTSRDARVTTILRYLIAIGELPMDYDTGLVVQTAAHSSRPIPTAHPPRSEAAGPKPDTDQRGREQPRPREGGLPEGLRGVEPGGAEPQPIAEDPPVMQPSDGAGAPQGDITVRLGPSAVDEFARFAQLGKPEDVEVALRVLEWAAGRGLRVRWGSRSSDGSFALVLDVGNLSFWMMTVWAIGTVEVQFAMMLAQPPFSDIERRRDLASRLNLVQGVHIDDKALGGRPRVPLASLRDQEDWDLFTGAMDWALDQIRSHFEPARGQTRDAGAN